MGKSLSYHSFSFRSLPFNYVSSLRALLHLQLRNLVSFSTCHSSFFTNRFAVFHLLVWFRFVPALAWTFYHGVFSLISHWFGASKSLRSLSCSLTDQTLFFSRISTLFFFQWTQLEMDKAEAFIPFAVQDFALFGLVLTNSHHFVIVCGPVWA